MAYIFLVLCDLYSSCAVKRTHIISPKTSLKCLFEISKTMSDLEEESCYYGTPLEPFEENAFPKKKPIAIEDQVAKDAQGRRRFHGAFTGGFSAGFFNTVGSLEGWTPTEFRSSRNEKAVGNIKVPEDYMDDEDLGQFGIAPQTVRTTNEYTDSKKRKKKVYSDGPIPGVPVLETLIEAGNESVGYFLMKNMNRRHHQQANTGIKVYGCVMPLNISEDDDIQSEEIDLHECYKQYLKVPKSNSFGLGYTSLVKTHLNLFQPAKLTVCERNNKKLSISGQAFGVGAFEDDDEDIYVKDDMTRYDFELTSEAAMKKKTSDQQLLFDLFIISSKNTLFTNKTSFPPPVIPVTFTGKHKVKKSRFEPISTPEVLVEPTLDASVRAKYLGETSTVSNPVVLAVEIKEEKAPPQIKNEVLDNILVDRFVLAKQSDDTTNILARVERFQSDHGTKEMHAAVKMKMFGPLTRITLPWQPCACLCKRFNVPEPHFDDSNAQKRKRTKNLIFEYQKQEEKPIQREPGLELKPLSNFSLKDCNSIQMNESITCENKTNYTTEASSVGIEPMNPIITKTIDVTERLNVSEKTDLFKAVFLSSSESEVSDTEDKEEDTKKKELITANILSEPLVPKIKPIKEGILSNLNFAKALPFNEPEKLLPTAEETNTYGPRLPNTLPQVSTIVINEPVSNIDEWVEKDDVAKDKKRKKKHNKEKKKHKHKSKR